MDDVTKQLILENESLKLRLSAVEDALTNLAGFSLEAGNNSRQGRIVFERKPIVPEVKEESVTE